MVTRRDFNDGTDRWLDEDTTQRFESTRPLPPGTTGQRMWVTDKGHWIFQEWVGNEGNSEWSLFTLEKAHFWMIYHGYGTIGQEDPELET